MDDERPSIQEFGKGMMVVSTAPRRQTRGRPIHTLVRRMKASTAPLPRGKLRDRRCIADSEDRIAGTIRKTLPTILCTTRRATSLMTTIEGRRSITSIAWVFAMSCRRKSCKPQMIRSPAQKYSLDSAQARADREKLDRFPSASALNFWTRSRS